MRFMPSAPLPVKIADFAMNHAVIRGAAHKAKDVSKALDKVAVSLELNGKEVATGLGSAVLEHPINSLTWLANHLADRGLTLEPGHLIITGASCLFREAKQGDKVRASFSSLGEVQCSI